MAWRREQLARGAQVNETQRQAERARLATKHQTVPFVWLLFPFSRRFRGYDHTVFTTYSITFMIALVAVVSLLFYFGAASTGGLLLFYAPFHMYRQLRGTYSLGRFGAIWRMLVLSMFAWVAIGLFAAVIAWMAGH